MAGPAPDVVVEEKQLGGSQKARDANDALRALSKASRAFTLYDVRNEAIRRFLGEWREKAQHFLTTHGVLRLVVEPFALLVDREPVYSEEDRERSLSFRLFRDGVRELTIQPAAPWEELLRLLEILSVRFTGVRQSEDDLVSLLRRAAFRSIQFDAVEGFVPEEEEPEADSAPTKADGDGDGLDFDLGADGPIPADFDLPPPAPVAPGAFGHREVPEKYLLALRSEESAETLPERVVRLATELLRGEVRPSLQESTITLAELRDFLVADRRAAGLAAFLTALEALPPEQQAPLIQPLLQPDPLRTLLEAGPLESPTPDPALLPLFLRLGRDASGHLVALLADLDPREKNYARQLLAALAKGGHEDLNARIAAAEPAVARELFTVLVEAQPDAALEAAETLAAQGDAEGQQRILAVLKQAPVSDRASRLLQGLLAANEPELRAEAVRLVVSRKEPRGFDLLVKHAERIAPHGVATVEAEAIAEALVGLSAKTALPILQRWCTHKQGVIARSADQRAHRALLEIGFLGLALHPEPTDALIKELGSKLDDETKPLALAAMHRRRARGRG